MNRVKKGALGAVMALASTSATAQDYSDVPAFLAGSEIAVGVLEHAANFHPLSGRMTLDMPTRRIGQIYGAEKENCTADVQFTYRSPPLHFFLKPRLTAKIQVSTGGRTNFASFGEEWRQDTLHGWLYGQAGIGVTVHDGYSFTPEPYARDLTASEVHRRRQISSRRTSFGSPVLFNPNASIGVRVSERWAVEASWEHFSHAGFFSKRNPGIDNIGLRLVRTLGR